MSTLGEGREPRRRAAAALTPAPGALVLEGVDTVSRRRSIVLIVDDESSVRRAFRLILGREFEVVEASRASRALAIVRSRPIDLVLLDIDRQDTRGLEVLQRLRETSGNLRVILLTAVADTRTLVTAIKLGALDYLTKPVQPEEFTMVVRRAFATMPIVVIGDDCGLRASVSVFLRLTTGAEITSRVGRTAWAPAPAGAEARLIDLTGVTDTGPLLRGVCERPRLARVTTAAVQHVAAHYPTATVESLAGALSAAPSYLTEVFRRDTGIGAKEYISRVRVEVAGYLLRETHDKQDTVAQHVGLCDAAHLSRWFRRLVGRTPGDYRACSETALARRSTLLVRGVESKFEESSMAYCASGETAPYKNSRETSPC